MIPIRETKEGATFVVRVAPRASRTAITGVMGDAIKIALAAPLVNGKANETLIAYLADILKISQSRVEITAGMQARNKIVRIRERTAAQITTALEQLLPDKHVVLP